MAIVLPPLPYAKDALVPYLTAETIDFHYGKHHNAYVVNLNKFIEDGKVDGSKSLEEIILSSDGPVFNNAAQVWNHTFFWNSLKPAGGGKPTGAIAAKIDADFGSYEAFRAEFIAAAMGQFGSGWAWLVLDGGKLKITKTSNADLPLKAGHKAIITIDVWEHAYYIDYRNLRAKFVETFFDKLVNWSFAQANFA